MAAEEKEPWDLVIGQVTAPFGVKGALRVRPETDFPERFGDLDEVCLGLPTGEERFFPVRRAQVTAKGVTLALVGCDDRDTAASLRGALVKIRQSMSVPLPEGSFWIHNVVGLRVVTEQGEELGEVIEVIRTPGNDVYVTPCTMVPAVREVIRKIDLDEGVIVITPLAEDEPEQDEAGG
jgi:16S rRNA processing protein RimM